MAAEPPTVMTVMFNPALCSDDTLNSDIHIFTDVLWKTCTVPVKSISNTLSFFVFSSFYYFPHCRWTLTEHIWNYVANKKQTRICFIIWDLVTFDTVWDEQCANECSAPLAELLGDWGWQTRCPGCVVLSSKLKGAALKNLKYETYSGLCSTFLLITSVLFCTLTYLVWMSLVMCSLASLVAALHCEPFL